MNAANRLEYRIAVSSDFEAIHRLNYKTFVEEIPQHPPNAESRLVDRFHAENTYAVCLDGQGLVGMVAGRAKRPFSLDSKLSDLDSYLPQGHKVVEMRLLAIEREYRSSAICCRLISTICRYFSDHGFDLAVISGTLRQLKLYSHMGTVPFGPVVGAGDALYQPMYVTLDALRLNVGALFGIAECKSPASFLPGPVDVQSEVRKAFEKPAISHRSGEFMSALSDTRRLLCELTNAAKVEILLGSGTLANDAVCAQLALPGQPGLVLCNGEFGERLRYHAAGHQLNHEVYSADWGHPFDYGAIRKRLEDRPDLTWIWGVHCETSTGVLNDMDELKHIAADLDRRLCMDCISSIGTVPVSLSGVYLASCVSGKALGSFSGLSMVFYNHELSRSARQLPPYLDLNRYAEERGVPFTSSSNLVFALKAALETTCWGDRFDRTSVASGVTRNQLAECGFELVAADACASPAVVTVALPSTVSSQTIGKELARAGYLLSFQSDYLLNRNWIQVCFMGEWSRERLERLPEYLVRAYGLLRKNPAARDKTPHGRSAECL